MDCESNYEEERKRLGSSFGRIAQDYANSRPTYSDAPFLDDHLAEMNVLELGAGTGLFSHVINRRKTSSFYASDLSFEMLAANKDVSTSSKIAAAAEALPFPNSTFDTVAVAQAAHWFDLDIAPREIRRIMRENGSLIIIWNHRDSAYGWIREFDRVVDSYQNRIVTDEILKGFEESKLFTKFSHYALPLLHSIDEMQAIQLINSFSPVSTLPDEKRHAVIDQAMEILRDAHPGGENFEIPYTTNYFLAHSI